MSEESFSRDRKRLFAKVLVVILVLAVNVACVLTVVSLVESGTATPAIQLGNFMYGNNGNNASSAYVSIEGTVVNPSSLAAENVSVLLDVYDQFVVTPVNSTNLYLGTIPGRSSASFETNLSYSGSSIRGSYFNDFQDGDFGVDSGLLLASRFDFGLGFFVIVLPMAVVLFGFDLYSAYRLGLFGWINSRKRVVATTVVWAGAVALLLCIRFWLFYAGMPGIGLSNMLDVYPELYFWDWIFVFLLSIGAGAIIAEVGSAVYSFLAALILSTILEFTYGSFYAWFDLGYSGSFTLIIPGMNFTSYLQSVLQDVFLNFLRMINLAVPCFLALGVFIGVIARSYFDPSIDV